VQKFCFMVMPFGKKPTSVPAGKGPAEIDFNRLWDLAYVPVIKELGYEPIRADQDTGSMIVTQMLERLYFADLVLADMSIPNGNVYYEVGIRHAAKEGGCVLLAADWSQQLFDVAQMRSGRYPLPEGSITEETADAIRPVLKQAIQGLSQGRSPMHDCIKGYPDKVDMAAASTMQAWLKGLATFQAEIRAVRAAPKSQQLAQAMQLANRQLAQGQVTPDVGLGLVRLLRDCASKADERQQVIELLNRLPANTMAVPEIQEQHALLLSQTGSDQDAVAHLLKLIETLGPTPERQGLLGGRFKRLALKADNATDRQAFLNKAIKSYEDGMYLDINSYYCSSNLARLYRARGKRDDERKALNTSALVLMACERAQRRQVMDDWLLPTQLSAAFDLRDEAQAESFMDALLDQELEDWKRNSVRADLDLSTSQCADEAMQSALRAISERLANV
jgi:hypothetical protein